MTSRLSPPLAPLSLNVHCTILRALQHTPLSPRFPRVNVPSSPASFLTSIDGKRKQDSLFFHLPSPPVARQCEDRRSLFSLHLLLPFSVCFFLSTLLSFHPLPSRPWEGCGDVGGNGDGARRRSRRLMMTHALFFHPLYIFLHLSYRVVQFPFLKISHCCKMANF